MQPSAAASNPPTQPPPAVPQPAAPHPAAPATVPKPSARDRARDRDKGFAPDSGKFIAPLPFPTQSPPAQAPPAQAPTPATVSAEPVTVLPPTKSPAPKPTPPVTVAPPPVTLTLTTAAGGYAPAPVDDVSGGVVEAPAPDFPPAVETYPDGMEAMADPAAAWPETYYEVSSS
jgi:hypothetical protein